MELRVVLAELAGGASRPQPARGDAEATARRGITLVPSRGAEVVLS